MSDAFSSYNRNNYAAIEQFNGGVGINFTTPNFRTQSGGNLESLCERLKVVKEKFNLDQSEAARRIFIDLFLVQALVNTKHTHGIMTAEFTVPADLQRIGHGRLDYVLSSIDATNQQIIPLPCVVIEAKKNNLSLPDAKWQLLAELVTLTQIFRSVLPFLRGITTDGQHWYFLELDTTRPHKTGPMTCYETKEYDVLNGEVFNTVEIGDILGILQYWFTWYSSKDMPILAGR